MMGSKARKKARGKKNPVEKVNKPRQQKEGKAQEAQARTRDVRKRGNHCKSVLQKPFRSTHPRFSSDSIHTLLPGMHAHNMHLAVVIWKGRLPEGKMNIVTVSKSF